MIVSARDLALGWLTIGGADPFDWLAAARAGGFGYLGVKVAPRPGETPPSLLRDVGLRREFAAECLRADIGLLNMGSIWLDGATPPDDYALALDIGAELQAEYVVGISTDTEPERRYAQMHRLAAMANERGMRMTIEFFAYSTISDFQQARNMVAEIGKDRAGVLFDALHFHRSGGVCSEISLQDAAHVDYLQLCDAPWALPTGMTLSEEGRAARLLPGEGDIPLGEILNRLPEAVRIEIEIPYRAWKTLSPVDRGQQAMQRALAFLNAEARRRR